MFQLNTELFAQIVQQSKTAAEGKPLGYRWQNAIEKAERIINTSNLWEVTRNGVLILLSPDSEFAYETDGKTCVRTGEERVHCPAFAQGFPCKHRAMHRLLTRYVQAEASETEAIAA